MTLESNPGEIPLGSGSEIDLPFFGVMYCSNLNKRAGPNKRAGWNFAQNTKKSAG